jgi:hypothetical protein
MRLLEFLQVCANVNFAALNRHIESEIRLKHQ